MEENIIYISQNKEIFQAEGSSQGQKVANAISLDILPMNPDGILNIIASINNSLHLVNTFGEKAYPFIEDKIDYSEFAQSVGGRENITSPKELLPIKFKPKDATK